jgi:hypothetical protein
MASKQEQQFVENLQSFTDSLEAVVNLLQEQYKTNPTDAINSLAENLDAEKLTNIVNQLETIEKKTAKIEDNTEKILQMQKDSRKAKETGMFGKIEDGDNKKKVVDGIKAIVLIAGGVLALGMAFKIIGKVDFLSVIALSTAMLIMAATARQIGEIEGLDAKKAMMVGLMMIVMAGAIVATSQLLRLINPLDKETLITVIGIAGAMGLSLFLIVKALDKIDLSGKDVSKILLLPLIVPIIAAAIVASSWILSQTYPLSFGEMLSIILASISIGIATMAMAPAIWFLGKIPIQNLLLGSLAVIIVSAAIMVSSLILSLGKYEEGEYPSFRWSLGVGLSLVTFGLMTMLLGAIVLASSGLGLAALALGGLAAFVVAFTIAGVSYLIQAGDYSGGYPSLWWSLGVGLAMIGFGTAMIAVGMLILATGGLGLPAIYLAANIMELIAWTVVSVSHIIPYGNYDKGAYPPLKWSIGVGAAMLGFGAAMIAVGMLILQTAGLGILGINLASQVMETIAWTVVMVSHIIPYGNYSDDSFPPLKWTIGVGAAMLGFGSAMLYLGMMILQTAGLGALAINIGANNVAKIAWALVNISHIIPQGDYSSFPPLKWTAGVGLAMLSFGYSTMALGLLILGSFGGGLIMLKIGAAGMREIAETIKEVSNIIQQGSYGSFPSLKWTAGVGLALTTFASQMAKLKIAGLIAGLFGGKGDGMKSIALYAQYIRDISYIINEGVYDNYPTTEWVNGLTEAADGINKLAKSIERLGKGLRTIENSNLKALRDLSGSLLTISVIDQVALSRTLKEFEDNIDKLTNTVEISPLSKATNTTNTTMDNNPTIQKGTTMAGSEMSQLVNYVKNIDKNLSFIRKQWDEKAKRDKEISKGEDVRIIN